MRKYECDQCHRPIHQAPLSLEYTRLFTTVPGVSAYPEKEAHPKQIDVRQTADFCSWKCISRWLMEYQKVGVVDLACEILGGKGK